MSPDEESARRSTPPDSGIRLAPPAPHASSGVAGCTVATRSYLADARLAARSFLDQHPGSRFTVVVVDGDHMPPAGWTHREVELVTPTELGLDPDELLRMAAIYSPFEIACALKPLALRRALEAAPVAVYVDGDVEVLSPMDELIAMAADTDVVLVPHVLDPVPQDGRLPDEPGLLGAGMFNGGLLAVRRSSGDFLDWWQERLHRHALGRPDLMMLADQRWLDFVPVLFDHRVLRDPTYDVAYWNLHERPTAWVDGQLCVVDRPVRCFHYSGLTDERPWMLTAFTGDRPRVRLADLPAVARQCRGWLSRRRAVDADTDRALGYHWSRTARGVEVDRRSRMLWRDALLAAESASSDQTSAPPPSPFADDGGAAWEDWLRTPDQPGELPRYLNVVWQEAPDLRRRFPLVPGADVDAVCRWATTDDADRAEIPDALRTLPEEHSVAPPTPPRPVRRPPRPGAAAQQPVAALARAEQSLGGPVPGPRGRVGQVLDRLLAGRDQRNNEVGESLVAAVEELAQRVAELADRVDRTNDKLHDAAVRADEVDVADQARAAEIAALADRFAEAEQALVDTRDDLSGAHEQHRITAAIVADAEAKIIDDIGLLRQQVDKITADRDAPAETDTEASPALDEQITATPSQEEHS